MLLLPALFFKEASFAMTTWFLPLSLAMVLLPPESNLLKNAGFEEGAKTPSQWQFNHRKTDGEIAWDRDRGRGGSAAVRITNRQPDQSGNVLQAVRFDPPLEPGSRVDFSAYAAVSDSTVPPPRIIVSFHSDHGKPQSATATATGIGTELALVRGQAVLQQRVQRLIVYLCNYGAGTVWWDDAQLTVKAARKITVHSRAPDREAMPALSTGDGLGLVLDDAGAVTRILLDGQPLAKRNTHSGLWLRPYDGNYTPVTGKLSVQEKALRQQFETEQLGLRLEARLDAKDGLIRCRGAIQDLTGTERGLDLFFSLPVGGESWRWGQSIREELPLKAGPHAQRITTFSSISDPETGQGLALAVPADAPCDCAMTFDADFGYAVRFRIGLSQAAGSQLKGRSEFHFVLYRCDGRWGLRDAARRYYSFWPKAFAKRVRREGLWLFGSPRFTLPDPESYAFHEGGPAGWEYDEEHDIYTCPYIIPGQREITRLERLPANPKEALEIFQQFGAAPAAGTSRPGNSLTPAAKTNRRKDWGRSIKQIIENCLLHDADGLPWMRIRNTKWGGNSITFPLNANPHLFAGSDKPTVAKALLTHVAEIHEEIPALDGIYVDSLGAWGQYLNHRQEHFVDAQVPLTYDPANGRPVIPNRFTLLEFLWDLRDFLHDRNKLLFANGVHHNRRFHFFALDVMGVEGRGHLEQKRVMAFQKPFLLLIYNIHKDPVAMEHYFHLCTFYGIYPSFAHMREYETPEMYAPVAALNRRFVPVLQAITAAGWQPITHARSSAGDVWLERWGPDDKGAVYLSLYNSAEAKRNTVLDIATAELGLDGARLTLTDELSEETWSTPMRSGRASLRLSAVPQQTRVLQLRAQ